MILQPDELEELVPPESRDIELLRFVPTDALGDQWYERPYYLGPDGHTDDYFAFGEALARQEVIGIARWVMRQKRYLGAISVVDGYLVMTTLRRAEQPPRREGRGRGAAVRSRLRGGSRALPLGGGSKRQRETARRSRP